MSLLPEGVVVAAAITVATTPCFINLRGAANISTQFNGVYVL